jgi:hypothetical protein
MKEDRGIGGCNNRKLFQLSPNAWAFALNALEEVLRVVFRIEVESIGCGLTHNCKTSADEARGACKSSSRAHNFLLFIGSHCLTQTVFPDNPISGQKTLSCEGSEKTRSGHQIIPEREVLIRSFGWVDRFVSSRTVAGPPTRNPVRPTPELPPSLPCRCESKEPRVPRGLCKVRWQPQAFPPPGSTNRREVAARERWRAQRRRLLGRRTRLAAFRLLAQSRQFPPPAVRAKGRHWASHGRMWKIGDAMSGLSSRSP